MESMSAKFATMIQILTFSGEITVLENKKVPYKMDRKPVIPWPLLRRDKMKYYENKEKDIQAIKIADSVYLVNIVYIKDTPFIFASKRDMRSIRGKNFVEIKLEVLAASYITPENLNLAKNTSKEAIEWAIQSVITAIQNKR